jgi:hypothetical protein
MGLQLKTIKSKYSGPADITVSVLLVPDDKLLIYEVTATCGSTTKTQRHTIGANGTGPVLDVATLQKIVDDYRQAVADEAAWFESAKLAHALIT